MSAMNKQVLVSAQTVAKLKPCLPKLTLFVLWFELDVLSRLIYNGKNKHRQDRSFQKLEGVSRRLKKYKPVSKYLIKNCERMVKINDTKKAKALQNCVYVGREERLLVQSILESATFIADLVHFTEDTWREVHQHLTRNVFIPFNVLRLSCLSRIWYCLRFHLLGLADTYHVLLDILPDASVRKLPGSVRNHLKEPYRKYLAAHTSGQSTNDSTLRMKIAGDPGLSLGDMDTGVAVVLNEAEQLARLKDTGAPSGIHFHGNQQPAAPPESDLGPASAAELRPSHVMLRPPCVVPCPPHVMSRPSQSSSVPHPASTSKRSCAGSIRDRQRVRWKKARLFLLKQRRRMGKLTKADVVAMLPQKECPRSKKKQRDKKLKKKQRDKNVKKRQRCEKSTKGKRKADKTARGSGEGVRGDVGREDVRGDDVGGEGMRGGGV